LPEAKNPANFATSSVLIAFAFSTLNGNKWPFLPVSLIWEKVFSASSVKVLKSSVKNCRFGFYEKQQ